MSDVLRLICKVGLAVAIFIFSAALLAILIGQGAISFFDSSVPVAPLTVPARLALAIIIALTMAVSIKGFYHLYRLFGNYGRGDIFTTDSSGHIRQFGIVVLLWFGLNILWAVVVVALKQAHTPISIPLHSDGLVTGPVLIVISWFMEMAVEMREENELTI